MSIVHIDWQQFLAPDSELPPDVTFDVLGDWESTQVVAHRFLLAGTSSVFRKMFFGAMKESDANVVIKDTTVEAFTTMIEYIYTPPGSDQFSLDSVSCPLSLCEILDIAERYDVPGLRKAAEDALKVSPITGDNVLFFAATAKNYSMFEDVSKTLTLRCLMFLTDQLRSAKDVFSLILQSHHHYPEADPSLLHELLLTTAESALLCRNCQRNGTDCLDGKEVTGLEEPAVVRKGIRVRVSHSLQEWWLPVGSLHTVGGLYTSDTPGGGLATVEEFPAPGSTASCYVTLDDDNAVSIRVRDPASPDRISFACSSPVPTL